MKHISTNLTNMSILVFSKSLKEENGSTFLCFTCTIHLDPHFSCIKTHLNPDKNKNHSIINCAKEARVGGANGEGEEIRKVLLLFFRLYSLNRHCDHSFLYISQKACFIQYKEICWSSYNRNAVLRCTEM